MGSHSLYVSQIPYFPPKYPTSANCLLQCFSSGVLLALGWNNSPQVCGAFGCLAVSLALTPKPQQQSHHHKSFKTTTATSIPEEGTSISLMNIIGCLMWRFPSRDEEASCHQHRARKLTVVPWPHHSWATCLPALYLKPQAHRVVSDAQMMLKDLVFV